MNNLSIASLFYEIADMLEMKEVAWKPRAYRSAARALEGLTVDVSVLYKKGGIKGLKEIPGVGEHLANKIIEYLETGKIKEYVKLKKKVPGHLDLILKIPGMGPKKAKKLYALLKISSVQQLKKAAAAHKISSLPGFGIESEKDILESISLSRLAKGKLSYGQAYALAQKVIKYLRRSVISKLCAAGSLRRKKALIGDIDILATSKNRRE